MADDRFLWGTDRFFEAACRASLVSSWIPALDDVERKLRAGARVADVGCGFGASTIAMAEAYPASTFVGYDAHERSIEAARKRAAEAGVADRVTFEMAPANDYPGSGFDLVAVFDALHDMGDPVAAAAHILRSLDVEGTLMLVEPGEKWLREVVTAAGFTRFRRAAATPFNLILEARP